MMGWDFSGELLKTTTNNCRLKLMPPHPRENNVQLTISIRRANNFDPGNFLDK